MAFLRLLENQKDDESTLFPGGVSVRNWSNQEANPALKTKTGNKLILQIEKMQREQIANRAGSYFLKGGHSATQTDLKV